MAQGMELTELPDFGDAGTTSGVGAGQTKLLLYWGLRLAGSIPVLSCAASALLCSWGCPQSPALGWSLLSGSLTIRWKCCRGEERWHRRLGAPRVAIAGHGSFCPRVTAAVRR